jgi:hypothetical protein
MIRGETISACVGKRIPARSQATDPLTPTMATTIIAAAQPNQDRGKSETYPWFGFEFMKDARRIATLAFGPIRAGLS